ncbi:hypothetical protein Hypma_016604 [Hypsizygus marmoreus]|uniref:Uncharacterized protein n=1 Tax=Hypsizygus marmoreus TaxID=39966 RepID=A0A369J1K2_HYPMA|nr:hypothetical protein Hypma_016604 [Hypsizygus marmoreus]
MGGKLDTTTQSTEWAPKFEDMIVIKRGSSSKGRANQILAFHRREESALVTNHSALQWVRTYENSNHRLAAWETIFSIIETDQDLIEAQEKAFQNLPAKRATVVIWDIEDCLQDFKLAWVTTRAQTKTQKESDDTRIPTAPPPEPEEVDNSLKELASESLKTQENDNELDELSPMEEY